MTGRLPTLVPRDVLERQVIQVWKDSGLADGTIGIYLQWVRRFRAHCEAHNFEELRQLTLVRTVAFAQRYVGPRRGRRVKKKSRLVARNALHAWWCAMRVLGVSVPEWRPPVESPLRPAVLRLYADYRRSHCGVAPTTVMRDVELASEFLRALHVSGRRIAETRVSDIDYFVDTLSARLARRTVAGLCSSLRCFLRFLRMTGRIYGDLATCVVAPRFRIDEDPPRRLPWDAVRQILRAIPRDAPVGRRDFAMFLLMASYGLGGAEIVQMRLDDIDWRNQVLRTRRAKTAAPLQLPLLPAVGRAIAAYLQRGRAQNVATRQIFLTMGLPHRSITTSVLRHRVRQYAQRAGVARATLGSHVFRHSHATRQIDAGAPAKIVSDILGHRRPSSTSVYVRLAFQRLRTVALPVPREKRVL